MLTCVFAITAACDDVVEPAAKADGPPAVALGALEVIEPGGDTSCARDTPFRFAVFGGDPNKVVIDFAGGGACWSAATCAVSSLVFAEEAPTKEQFAAWTQGSVSGLYAFDDARNPFFGWTVIHVPYCTGDIHWGDATKDYGNGTTIHHRGQANVNAVLDWVYARYTDIDEVTMAGCSAGAYGAIGYAPQVAEEYPNASMTVFADSGVGIITDTFFADSFPNWKADAMVPPAMEDVPRLEWDMASVYIAIANALPDARFAQYTTAYDTRQVFFYELMSGGSDWTERMRTSLAKVTAGAPNFSSYIAPGPGHCVLPYQHYYTRVSGPDDVDLVAWLEALVHSDVMPRPVTCAGDSCRQDPVCAACLAQTYDGAECRFCEDWQ
jgi:hypothetical protein